MPLNRYQYLTKNGKKYPIHKHVMIEHLGRELEPTEHVYHIDGDQTNNSIENLVVIRKKSWKPK